MINNQQNSTVERRFKGHRYKRKVDLREDFWATNNFNKIKSLLDFKSSWPLEKGYRQYIEWYLNLFEKNKN